MFLNYKLRLIGFRATVFEYTGIQGVGQHLEIGCPNLMKISKQGVQIVHLQYFYM